MEQALVLITIHASKDKEVLMEINEIDGVIEAHLISGKFDAYTMLESETMQQLQDVVINNIRNIDGVRSTITCFTAG